MYRSLLLRSALYGFAPVFLLFLAGCNSGGLNEGPPIQVSGTVLLDGKPLPKGAITFLANGSQTLDIIDGKFEGKVTPGEKVVEIRAFEGMTKPPPDHEPSMPFAAEPLNVLPDRYQGINSSLKATVSASGQLEPSEFKVSLK